MKRDDAIEAVQKAIRKLGSVKTGTVTRVGFLSITGPSQPRTMPEPRDPEFEFNGWRFYAKTGLWEDEATDDGDASVIAPDGTVFGLAWAAGAPLKHEFDFTPSFGPMLYVHVPSSVGFCEQLRHQLAQLAPMLGAELKSRGPS